MCVQSSRYNLPGKPVIRKIIHLEGGEDMIVPEPAYTAVPRVLMAQEASD